MRLTFAWILALVGTCAGGWLWQRGGYGLLQRARAGERWLDANHLRVQVKGEWRDVRMVPLSDHLCRSGQPLFERYCTEPHSRDAARPGRGH